MKKTILSLAVAGLVLSVGVTTTPVASPVTQDAHAASDYMEGKTLEQGRQLILDRVNAERKKVGLKPMTRSIKLDSIAQDWSGQQAKAQNMSHRPNFASGYPSGWNYAGENVAWGYSLSAVMNGWMNSPGHKANILEPSFNTIGIGIVKDKSGYPYYTQNFGAYSSGNPDPVKPPVVTPPKPAVNNPSIKNPGDRIAIDKSGVLWNYGKSGASGRTKIGSGWTNFTSIHTADWNGDSIQDIVAKHKDGTLYVYTGSKSGGFSSSKIGTGWKSYEITVGKWKKTDRLPTVIAKDGSGNLWAYGRNGNGVGNRVKVGTGWKSYNILRTDYNNDGAMDIVAKQSNGQLWLYPNNGAGKLNARKNIGTSGWNSYRLAAAPLHYGAKTNGIYTIDKAGALWHYNQKTNGTLEARKKVGSSGWNNMRLANTW